MRNRTRAGVYSLSSSCFGRLRRASGARATRAPAPIFTQLVSLHKHYKHREPSADALRLPAHAIGPRAEAGGIGSGWQRVPGGRGRPAQALVASIKSQTGARSSALRRLEPVLGRDPTQGSSPEMADLLAPGRQHHVTSTGLVLSGVLGTWRR